MKKQLLLTSLIATTALTLVGCGGGGGSSDSTKTTIDEKYIGVWHNEETPTTVVYVYSDRAIVFSAVESTNSCTQTEVLSASEFNEEIEKEEDEFLDASESGYLSRIESACGTYTSLASSTTPSTPSTPSTPTSGSDLTGTTWSVTETGLTENCGEGLSNDSYSISVLSYTGGIIKVNTTVGVQVGQYSGSNISYSGSYPEDGGTTISTSNLTLNSSSNQLTGMVIWSWSDGSMSCNGTSSVTATRN